MTAFFSWQHAIRSSELESTTKLVCYTIWSHMASDGTGCFPSYALIADESGLSRRCVIEHVDKAEKAGFLAVDARQRENGSASSNVYRPTMPGSDPGALGGDPGSLGGGDPAAPPEETTLSNNPDNIPSVSPKPKTKVSTRAEPKIRLTEWLEASGGCPPESLGEWANATLHWDSERISREWEAFADYWTSGNAVGGGRKSDWPATWRSSCRRQADRYPSQQRGAGGSQPSKLVAISSAVLAGRLAKQGEHGSPAGAGAGTGGTNPESNGDDLQAMEADLPEWAR